jgi:cytochrome c553
MMLAWGHDTVGLEIMGRSLYHSGVESSGHQRLKHNSLKSKVIIKTKTVLFAAILLASSASSPAIAEGDASNGKTLGYTCLGCHGIDGYRNAYPSYRVPKLGGQKAAYLIVALNGYREGSRAHPTMAAQASSLSDQQIEDVAAYLASLGTDMIAAGGSAAAGREETTACIACHGQNGIGLSPTWPSLAGQHEDYLVHALNQYRDGTRKDPVMAPMAAALTDDDVELLAKYYSRLDGLETTKAK